MNEDDTFRSKSEELQRLTKEMADIKSALKDIAAAVARIERHVRRSFNIAEAAKSSAKPPPTVKRPSMPRETAGLTPESALSLFDQLSVIFGTGNSAEVERQLDSMIVPDLKVLTRELGVALSSNTPKKALIVGVIGRLNERAMLSRNTNTTPSQKVQMEASERKGP
jgi:hypothetical protein